MCTNRRLFALGMVCRKSRILPDESAIKIACEVVQRICEMSEGAKL